MKKFLKILLIISIFCLLFASCNTEHSNSQKSLYEVAIEAGFDGTLEEWCRAIAHNGDVLDNKIECSCPNCQYPITLGDAIVIAQTHFFAVYYSGFDSSKMVEIVELLRDDSENWYINIVPRDVVNDGDEYIYKGQSYVYTISKENGTIIEIDASGE